MRLASIVAIPRRPLALAGAVMGALALLVLMAAPASAHPGHAAEPGHQHTLALGDWALAGVVIAVLAAIVVGVLLAVRTSTRRVEPVRP